MTEPREDRRRETAELRSEFSGLRRDLAARNAHLMAGFRRELYAAVRRRNREMVAGLVGVVLATLAWTWVLSRFVM